jgi:hypothetical protein
LAHVARLVAAGLVLVACRSGVVLYDTTDGRIAWSVSKAGAGLSDLPIRDLLNHDGFDDTVGESLDCGVGDLKLLSDCLRPSSREVEDFGRRGSTASAKYSWFSACVEVGLFLGSHIRHQVTKWLKDAGQ